MLIKKIHTKPWRHKRLLNLQWWRIPTLMIVKCYDLEVNFVNNGLVCLLNNPLVFDKIDLYRWQRSAQSRHWSCPDEINRLWHSYYHWIKICMSAVGHAFVHSQCYVLATNITNMHWSNSRKTAFLFCEKIRLKMTSHVLS